ncbi:Alpha/Beta hydrolase protein [Hyaloraphidium curvatum]|nr:Alpha/Beta hydrolase protein [Hyaloraphidium curvatum]
MAAHTPPSWTPEFAAAVAARRGPPPASAEDLVARQQALYALPPLPVPDGVKITPVDVPRLPVPGLEDDASGSFPAEWLEPAKASTDNVLLYIHGGAYCVCNPNTHRMITGGIARHGVRVLAIDYRLAPQSGHPAPLVDAISAIRYLLGTGLKAENIFLGGDSAGANCSLATTAYLRDHPGPAPVPAGLALITPWTDLTGISPTIHLDEEFSADWLGGGGEVDLYALSYTGGSRGALPKPYVSPLFDLPPRALPPVFASLGTVDRCYAEDLAFFSVRPGAAVDVHAEQVHVFPFFPELAQSEVFCERAAGFVVSGGKAPGPGGWNSVSYDGKIEAIPGGAEWGKRELGKLLERAEKLEGWKERAGKLAAPYEFAAGRK